MEVDKRTTAAKQNRTSLDTVSKFRTGEMKRPSWLSEEEEDLLDNMFFEIYPDKNGFVDWNTPRPPKIPKASTEINKNSSEKTEEKGKQTLLSQTSRQLRPRRTSKYAIRSYHDAIIPYTLSSNRKQNHQFLVPKVPATKTKTKEEKCMMDQTDLSVKSVQCKEMTIDKNVRVSSIRQENLDNNNLSLKEQNSKLPELQEVVSSKISVDVDDIGIMKTKEVNEFHEEKLKDKTSNLDSQDSNKVVGLKDEENLKSKSNVLENVQVEDLQSSNLQENLNIKDQNLNNPSKTVDNLTVDIKIEVNKNDLEILSVDKKINKIENEVSEVENTHNDHQLESTNKNLKRTLSARENLSIATLRNYRLPETSNTTPTRKINVSDEQEETKSRYPKRKLPKIDYADDPFNDECVFIDSPEIPVFIPEPSTSKITNTLPQKLPSKHQNTNISPKLIVKESSTTNHAVQTPIILCAEICTCINNCCIPINESEKMKHCDHCNIQFNKCISFVDHMQKVHSLNLIGTTFIFQKFSSLNEYINKTYNMVSKVNCTKIDIENNEENNEKVLCQICDNIFLNFDLLTKHMKIYHKTSPKMATNQTENNLKWIYQNCVCCVCKKVFNKLNEYACHLSNNHQYSVKYKCVHYKFACRKSQENNKQKEEEENRNTLCHMCPQFFNNCSELINHVIKVHKLNISTSQKSQITNDSIDIGKVGDAKISTYTLPSDDSKSPDITVTNINKQNPVSDNINSNEKSTIFKSDDKSENCVSDNLNCNEKSTIVKSDDKSENCVSDNLNCNEKSTIVKSDNKSENCVSDNLNSNEKSTIVESDDKSENYVSDTINSNEKSTIVKSDNKSENFVLDNINCNEKSTIVKPKPEHPAVVDSLQSYEKCTSIKNDKNSSNKDIPKNNTTSPSVPSLESVKEPEGAKLVINIKIKTLTNTQSVSKPTSTNLPSSNKQANITATKSETQYKKSNSPKNMVYLTCPHCDNFRVSSSDSLIRHLNLVHATYKRK